MTDTLIKPDISEDTISEVLGNLENDDAEDHKTHIINPPENVHIWRPGMSIQDVLQVARVKKLPVKALCGHIFVPERNPESYPACDDCMRIAGDLMREAGE